VRRRVTAQAFGRRESLTRRRELRRDLDAVVRPRRMAVASALAMPDRNRALVAVYSNIDRTSPIGATVAWAYEALLKINSSGVPIMFLEWSPTEVARARAALIEVGALETVSAIDTLFRHLGVDPHLRAWPDDALDVILSDEFEQWKREFLPEPLSLADKMRDHIFDYVRRHVEEL
jgi:hypothetical protein